MTIIPYTYQECLSTYYYIDKDQYMPRVKGLLQDMYSHGYLVR